MKNLYATVANIKYAPEGAVPNRSGAGAAVINALGSMARTVLSPLVKGSPWLGKTVQEFSKAREQNFAQEATKPGVSLRSILSMNPTQNAQTKLLTRFAVPVGVR